MKVLAIDYGERRVGLAVGDTDTALALPYGKLERRSDELLLEELQKIVDAEEIGTVVVGEPLTLSGGASAQTQACRAFAEFLRHHLDVPVELFDERLTSQRADAAAVGGQTRSRDELAAMFLLQDYLERQQGLTV